MHESFPEPLQLVTLDLVAFIAFFFFLFSVAFIYSGSKCLDDLFKQGLNE